MSAQLVACVAVIYAYVAVEQLWKGNVAGFIIWASYSTANIGLIWQTK